MTSRISARSQLAAGAHLDEQVAHRGGLDGTGHDGALASVGRELVKDGALRAAADDMNDLDPVAGEFLQPTDHFAILEREALVGAPDQLALGLRHRLLGFAAEILDGLRHVGRVEEARIVGLTMLRSAGALAAIWASCAYSYFRPRASKACLHCWTSHRPMMFLSRR
jgi:hypothetical protein